ncbi:MAG: hypothetical protein AAF360_16770, partial [Pseudomonadota bacterium]
MSAPAPSPDTGSAADAILLDVTRTISRAGLGPATGIDRVERAWIDWALSDRWRAASFLAVVKSG